MTKLMQISVKLICCILLIIDVLSDVPPSVTPKTSSTIDANRFVRIKDIVEFEGVRENLLIGYGLVVGLNGTGDTVTNSPQTKQSLTSMLERLGVNVRSENIQAKNVAAVMVTANLPPFGRQGAKIDVTVSSLGDAKDLKGGTLLVTPLLGADGNVYAVSQGPITVGGFKAEGKGQTVTKGVPTGGKIMNGAIIEREVPFDLNSLQTIHLSMRNPDFTTAMRISQEINTNLGEKIARAVDPSTVSVRVPHHFQNNVVQFMTTIEQLMVSPDITAKVIIDDHDGVIVMGHNVRISPVAVSHGSITVKVVETPQVSQPNPFAPESATTVTVDRTAIDVEEKEGQIAILRKNVTLQELVNALNLLGATPRELISILHSIKAAGALQADIEVI